MALDEIRLTPGRCRQFVVTTTLPPPPPTTKQPTPPVTQGMFCSGEGRGFIRSVLDSELISYGEITCQSLQIVQKDRAFIDGVIFLAVKQTFPSAQRILFSATSFPPGLFPLPFLRRKALGTSLYLGHLSVKRVSSVPPERTFLNFY